MLHNSTEVNAYIVAFFNALPHILFGFEICLSPEDNSCKADGEGCSCDKRIRIKVVACVAIGFD